MSDKEPGAREHPLQFLAVDLVIDKDLAADLPRRHIDETAAISRRPFARHRPLLGVWLNYAPMSPCLAAGRQLARPLRRHRQDLARIARRRRPRQRTTRPPL